MFQGGLKTYAAGLRWVLRHQPLMLVVTAATICLSVYLYIVIPKGFFPQQDTGRMTGTILGAQDISFTVDAAEVETIHGHRHERSRGGNHEQQHGGGAENIGRMRWI